MVETLLHHWLEIEELGGVTLVRLLPRKLLDEYEIRDVGRQLLSLPESGRANLAVDFGNVEYVTSALTGKLIHLQRKAKANGGKLVLCRLNPSLADMFHRAGLHRLFDIQPSVTEGLQQFER